MLISYLVLSVLGGDLRMKSIGIILTIANALIFFK